LSSLHLSLRPLLLLLLSSFSPPLPPPPRPTLFPYTTLFRSVPSRNQPRGARDEHVARSVDGPSPGHGPRSSAATPGSRSVLRSRDRKSTRLNSSHGSISYAVFCLKKKIICHVDVHCTVWYSD